MADDLYDGEHADLQRKLDHILSALRILERRALMEGVVIFFLALGLVVTTTGWWLVAQDHSATKRAGGVADCRAAAQAQHLDAFQTIADPARSDAARRAADITLHRLPTLVKQYAACAAKKGG